MRTAVLLLLFLSVACGQPRTATVAEQASQIEGQVWSPYCPGRLLIDCTTEQAGELRADIKERLRSGQGSDAVLRWIRLNFGDEALARPSSPVVWAVPIAIFAIAAVAVALLMRRWRSRVDSLP